MRLRASVLALALLAPLPSPAQTPGWPVAAQYEANRKQPTGRAIARAAELLEERQGAFSDPAGGSVRRGWEWRLGSRAGAENCSGIVALALLEGGAQEAARARADEVIAQARRGVRLYAPDVELVARLARSSGDRQLLLLAQEQVRARLAGGVEAEVERLVAARGENRQLVGYDVAQLAEAALEAGERELAAALVREAVRREAAWRGRPGDSFALVSAGALAAAASRLELRGEAIGAALVLLAAQDDEGSWHGHETQATAYATRGLALVGRTFGDRGAERAARRGAEWLRLTQLRNGAWADYNDYLPEPWVGDVLAPASAEALRAILALR